MACQTGWIVYNSNENLQEFLAANKPSQIDEPRVFWVSVGNQTAMETDDDEDDVDFDGMMKSWNELAKTPDKINKEAISVIAKESGCLTGKWLVFKSPAAIDEVWEKIAIATADGQLGLSAKVSTRGSSCRSEGEDHVICVHTEDFTDETNVMEVEEKLRELGITGSLSYKPDVYTYLNIYRHNSWGLSTSVYST